MTQALTPVINNKPKMLTIPQLEATGILPGRAIRRLISEGKISCVTVGNRRYVNFTRFCEYLNSGAGEE